MVINMYIKSTTHHVSCSPSKIPDIGFSPVRLKTGIRMQPLIIPSWFKCETHIRHSETILYAIIVLVKTIPFSFSAILTGSANRNIPVQSPLARLRVMLSHWVIAYYGLMCPSLPSRYLIYFVYRVFALRSRMGWYREVPQFNLCFCAAMPSSVPRRFKQLQVTVSSLLALTFAIFVVTRLTQSQHVGSLLGRVTRLQSSLYATAWQLASPSPTRAFTSELSSLRSPQRDVRYNYMGKQSIPMTGLSPVKNTALWAANEAHEEKKKMV